jgi:MFS family permease
MVGQMNKTTISLLPVYFTAFLNFLSFTLLFPIMPLYAASLGGTVTQVALAVAIQPYVTAITQLPIAILSDRLGRRTVLITGLVAFILSYLAYAFTSTMGVLIAVRIVNGLAAAAFYPAASAMVVDIAPKEKLGEALGLFTTGTQLGSMIGPTLGGLLLQHYNYRVTFLSSVAISLAGLLFALSKLKHVSEGSVVSLRESFSLRWLGKRECIVSMTSNLLITIGLASFIAFLPLYGPEININVAQVGLIITTIYIGSVLPRFLAGRLSDRLGRIPIILAGLLLCALGVFPFFFLSKAIPMHLAAFIFGVGIGSAYPACAALIADKAPFTMRGFAMGINSGMYNAGMALGTTGLGILADSVGFPRMYLVASVIIGISIPILSIIARKSRRSTRE